MRFKAKRSSEGSSSGRGSGHLRLTILLATVAAFLLVPVAQAAANPTETVHLSGTGTGEVSSVGGAAAMSPEFEEFGPAWEGEPPLECSNIAGEEKTACEEEMVEDAELFPETYGLALHAVAGPGSRLVGWTVEPGGFFIGCEAGFSFCFVPEAEAHVEVTAIFGPAGPTNRATLTVTKSAGGSGGTGSVSSKPKGIKCSAGCNSALASMYKGTPVTLKEKPSNGSTFTEWTGACSGAAETCTVPMAEAEAVGAVFGGTSKAIVEPTALTIEKEGSGEGTVKGPGLGCEAQCSETTVLFQGPITEPKPKPGKTVTLKQAPAFGSEFSGWSGCEAEPEGNCVVEMSEAKTVTATYTALPNVALTVDKSAYEGGSGSVSSKPKGIKCAANCSTAVAAMPEGASVVLTEKPSNGNTFTGWEGGGCSGTEATCTVEMSEAETVTAKFSGTVKALVPAETLTLTKAGSGFGTVKASGLACEVLCSSTSALYQGPITEPKPKAGKVVILTAVSAAGSKPVEWTGCE